MRMNRRQFLGTTATAGAGVTYGLSQFTPAFGAQPGTGSAAKPALLGGDPVRTGGFPSWPVVEKNDEHAKRRTENADYLTNTLKAIPGILPEKMYKGCTFNAYHLYMFRYHADQFGGWPRAKFFKAMGAEGIPCSSGYSPLNKEPMIKAILQTRAYQKLYPPEVLKNWEERTQCPVNDKLCQEAVWFTQTMLLGPRSEMDAIAEAIRRIHKHSAEVAKA